ncbi:alpha-1,2-fucosyltransferase [Oxalobacter vibrioformis]|uniref:Alpha-1,2-fucosyltransferase n=1 Tax=Oxalobacter vibrioformis TaxID=933080 RepID=A0A9E9LUI5_9BURK|nr:alpha-1,2-fucosyltransferase [Oxalobacter vibrioformis]WAW09109.1 alpha-1,2-fucosyltransferase [Oxalobacter vibrioformis]
MIVVRLKGGLGNQLFQYAVGFALAKKNKDQFKMDLSGYHGQDKRRPYVRSPDIMQFSVSASVASEEEVQRFRNPFGLASRVFRVVSQKVFKKYYTDWHWEIMNQKGNVYLEGFFQCEKYFVDCFDELSKEFLLQENLNADIEPIVNLIKSMHSPVSLHIRRGDYVSDPRISALHNICGIDYYETALACLKDQIGYYDLVVFSDDIEWVRNNLNLSENTYYVSGQKGVSGSVINASQELTLMSMCKHHIIANSTFSWWGAYLNQRQGKIVMAPGLWNRSKDYSHKNIIPPGWQQIPILGY